MALGGIWLALGFRSSELFWFHLALAGLMFFTGGLSLIVRAPLVKVNSDTVFVYGMLGLFHRTFRLETGDRLITAKGRLWIVTKNGARKRALASVALADRFDWDRMVETLARESEHR